MNHNFVGLEIRLLISDASGTSYILHIVLNIVAVCDLAERHLKCFLIEALTINLTLLSFLGVSNSAVENGVKLHYTNPVFRFPVSDLNLFICFVWCQV